MKKIALTAALVLAAAGGAFAGSDHYGSQNAYPQATSSVDSTYTSSVDRQAVKVQQDNGQTRATNDIQPQFRH
ncbi:DUF680 domain-containing protein [Mesorhizobium sp. SP-1A]|uniref:DUF680 domain-containing protein n=1 Tax=Mesorhizobium sp. SP-1A TaxID=3077840 RepID=UPI0028F74A9C|nr:DUF680 domain-containing protein [Mesorhizobium sp. SP-1A]